MNFAWNSYELRVNFVTNSYKLCTDFLQTVKEILTKFAQTFYKLCKNFVQNSYEICKNFIYKLCKKFLFTSNRLNNNCHKHSMNLPLITNFIQTSYKLLWTSKNFKNVLQTSYRLLIDNLLTKMLIHARTLVMTVAQTNLSWTFFQTSHEIITYFLLTSINFLQNSCNICKKFHKFLTKFL